MTGGNIKPSYESLDDQRKGLTHIIHLNQVNFYKATMQTLEKNWGNDWFKWNFTVNKSVYNITALELA